MIKIEVFFDYVCPYCYRGHKNLLALLDQYPQLTVTWRPCEAHPLPENWSVHSDLAIQGMYYIQERGGDIMEYHRQVYQAYFDHGLNVASLDVLASLAERCGVDTGGFRGALAENLYEARVKEGNRYAWVEKGLDAVPSYLSGRFFIGSRDGILVPAGELERFIVKLSAEG